MGRFRKYSSSIFLLTIFTSIVIFSCYLSTSIESVVKDQKLINHFMGDDSISFIITPAESATSWPQSLFDLPDDSIISKQLDDSGNLVGLYSTSDIKVEIEMREGRFFTKDDLVTREKIVVIGEELVEKTIKLEGKQYFPIGNENYEVIGILKNRRQDDWLGYRSYVNLMSLYDNINLLWVGNFGIDAGDSTDSVFLTLREAIEGEGFEVIQSSKELIQSPIERIMNDGKFTIFMFLFILFIFILNTISVTSYWIDYKTKEIGVKKGWGANNIHIAFDLLKDLLKITMISFVLGTLLYMLLSFAINQTIIIYFNSLFFSFFIIILSSILTTVIPIIKASKIQPIEMLR